MQLSRTLVVAVVATLSWFGPSRGTGQPLPARLSDKEFQRLIVDLSEDGGSFVSDNIISNEIEFQRPIPDLQALPRGVYLGVGPEQNFTYIVALEPSMAFIVDIRRGNLLLHLLYKALIELSADRVDFVSRLFARPRPPGLGREADARALFAGFAAGPADEAVARRTLRAILDRLQRTHGFRLSEDDRRNIAEIYRSLYVGGPNMRGDFGGGAWIPSYAQLMAQTDRRGHNHSFLESEHNFLMLKDYESRNLIVPLVGNFAGSKTIRAVGRYVRDHGAVVTTFYASNVEDYLFKDSTAASFFANVATLPIRRDSMFVRSFFTHTDAGLQTFLDPIGECVSAGLAGKLGSYAELIARSKAPRP